MSKKTLNEKVYGIINEKKDEIELNEKWLNESFSVIFPEEKSKLKIKITELMSGQLYSVRIFRKKYFWFISTEWKPYIDYILDDRNEDELNIIELFTGIFEKLLEQKKQKENDEFNELAVGAVKLIDELREQ